MSLFTSLPLNRRFFTQALLASPAALLLVGCGGGESPAPAPTSLRVIDSVVGTGATAAVGDKLTVNYNGYLFDGLALNLRGQKFDTSIGTGKTPFTFTLGAGQVIQGWDQGLVGMKVGGQRMLIIPADLGYGATGAGASIPPNAALVFDVALVSIGDTASTATTTDSTTTTTATTTTTTTATQ